MTWLFVVVAILVVAGAVMAMSGRLGGLPEAPPDLRPDRMDGQPAFDVVVRGYRMDEVDARITEMQAEIDRLSAAAPEEPRSADVQPAEAPVREPDPA